MTSDTRAKGARKTLLYVANVAWFFRSHRMPLALEAVRRGYDVHLATAFGNAQEREDFERDGIETHHVPFERSGTGVAREAAAILRLRQLYIRLRPALSHNVSIKPVIYGGLLSRLYGIPCVQAISGLGYNYVAGGFRARLRRSVLSLAYSSAVASARSRVIVQNEDDWAFFRRELGVDEHRLVMIKGSGVDLRAFDPGIPSDTPPLVVLLARMLADKGVREFAAAARLVKERGVVAKFALVGGLDPDNRAGLMQHEIEEITRDGALEYWGHRSDVAQVLEAARIVCLPSYREGFPKSLLEAAAAGRAIVATDVPGCREIVRHGENGLLVPPRDPRALADALAHLIPDAQLCAAMGQRGRALVEQYFSLDIVVSRTMQLYADMLR